jgi:hypothetical protein
LTAAFFYLSVCDKIPPHAPVKPEVLWFKEIFCGLRLYGRNPSDAQYSEKRRRMKKAALFTMVCLLLAAGRLVAVEGKLPVIDGKVAVATVNNDPITSEDLERAVVASHAVRPEGKKAGRIDYSDILARLIITRLLLLEAQNMGFEELPEIKDAVDVYSRKSLMELLLEQYVKDLKADGDEVERLYREDVKEWKIKAIKFKKEADAKKIEAELKPGNNFDAIAQKAVAEGIAEGGEEEYLKDKNLTPAIARLVSNMEIGSISPIVSIGKEGFIIFKLEGVLFPEQEDPETRKKVLRLALNQKRVRAAKDYYSDLRKQYVKINEELFDGLDYESNEPGFEKLLKDKRVIAEISGEKAITVGEFSMALKKEFYHGVQISRQSKRINKRKKSVLEGMVEKRVLLKEALLQGIDKTEAYQNRVKEYRNSVIFGVFIQKVVTPGIKLDVKELKTYYKENSGEYTFPEMMRIKSLVFRQRSEAVTALDKLRKGTDFGWLSSHAEGQVDKNSEGLLKFEGNLLALTNLPEDLHKTVSGAKTGDLRLYVSPEGYYYVLYIYNVVPVKPQPFEKVKKKIAQKVFDDKVKKAIEAYADKLKEYYPVKIYAKDLQ